jgi:hypothetical protein
MPPITDKSTALIVKIGVVYGFSASTYLAAWNSWDLILKKPFPFGLLSHEYLFLGFPILHAVMLVLCFQERSNGDLHWGSLLIAPLGLVRGAKYVLTFSVLYFFVLVLILIAKPRLARCNSASALGSCSYESVLSTNALRRFFLSHRKGKTLVEGTSSPARLACTPRTIP